MFFDVFTIRWVCVDVSKRFNHVFLRQNDVTIIEEYVKKRRKKVVAKSSLSTAFNRDPNNFPHHIVGLPFSLRYPVLLPLPFASLQLASLRFVSLQFASLQRASLQFVSVRFTSVYFTSVSFASLQCASLQFVSLQFTSV